MFGITHKKTYKIANGTAEPFDEIIEKIPPVHY